MSFKDLFFKPEDHVPPKSDHTTATAPSNNLMDRPAGVYTHPQTGVVQGVVDASGLTEFNKYFQKIMDDANLPGPDYYEFSKALESMNSLPLSEQQKFVAVFASFATQGVKPQALIDAASKYLQILEQKKVQEFDASVNAATQGIQQKKDKVDDLNKQNAELTAKIQANTTEILNLSNQVVTDQGKVESKKTTFNMAYNSFTQKIKEDIAKIQNYLNGNVTQ